MKHFIFICCLSLLLAEQVHAELTRTEEARPDGTLTVVTMTVTPAGESVPALRYPLAPPDIELEYGNAVPFYHRALTELQFVRNRFIKDEYGDSYYEWQDRMLPLKELPLDALQAVNGRTSAVIQELQTATHRTEADWGFNERHLEGIDMFSFLLPELQEMREIGRLQLLRARLAIIEDRFDDAVEELRLGYTAAHDLGTNKFLVGDLVGIAIAGSLMNVPTEEFIAAEGSPNLYWSLMALPDPLVNCRDSVEFELDNSFRVFPWLKNAEEQPYSPDEWRRLFTDSLYELHFSLGYGRGYDLFSSGNSDGKDSLRSLKKSLLATLVALQTYTPAKEALIDGGFEEAEVEQMPVAKVLSIQSARHAEQASDAMFKAWLVPWHESDAFDNAAGERFFPGNGNDTAVAPLPVAKMILPATLAVRNADIRLKRRIRGLIVLEAIRLHAAQTGTLPRTLDEIKVVPVPNNPATDEPFWFRRQGDTAVLELPFDDGMHEATRYEITLK